MVLKLPASTLVETLVSMTLISLVAGFAVVIFWQVSALRSSSGPLLMAQQHSMEMMALLEKGGWENSIPQEQWMSHANMDFKQTLTEVSPNLKLVHIGAFDPEGQLVYERKRLFYVPDEP